MLEEDVVGLAVGCVTRGVVVLQRRGGASVYGARVVSRGSAVLVPLSGIFPDETAKMEGENGVSRKGGRRGIGSWKGGSCGSPVVGSGSRKAAAKKVKKAVLVNFSETLNMVYTS